MHTPRIIWLLLLSIMLITTGCQQKMTVDTYSEPDFNHAAIKSYAWLPNGSAAYGVPQQRLAAIENSIKTAVDENLTKKGWQRVDAKQADVLVRFVIGAEDSYEVQRTGTTNVAGQQVKVPVEVKTLRSGRLAIDLLARQSGLIVWRGVAGKTTEANPDMENVSESIRKAVNSILKKLP